MPGDLDHAVVSRIGFPMAKLKFSVTPPAKATHQAARFADSLASLSSAIIATSINSAHRLKAANRYTIRWQRSIATAQDGI